MCSKYMQKKPPRRYSVGMRAPPYICSLCMFVISRAAALPPAACTPGGGHKLGSCGRKLVAASERRRGGTA